MLRSIVRTHHWSPAQMGDLFIDRADYLGIAYWYDDIKEEVEASKPKKKK